MTPDTAQHLRLKVAGNDSYSNPDHPSKELALALPQSVLEVFDASSDLVRRRFVAASIGAFPNFVHTMTYVTQGTVTAIGIIFPCLAIVCLAMRMHAQRHYSTVFDIDAILVIPATVRGLCQIPRETWTVSEYVNFSGTMLIEMSRF